MIKGIKEMHDWQMKNDMAYAECYLPFYSDLIKALIRDHARKCPCITCTYFNK